MSERPPVAPPGLVWLASYPKSGNTWMRALLANLMRGEAAPASINQLHVGSDQASNRALFERECLVDTSLMTLAEIESLRPRVYASAPAGREAMACYKTHEAWTLTADGTPVLGRAARAAIYLVRDPRDQAISWAHHLGIDVDQAIRRMTTPDTRLSDGRSHQLVQRLGDWSGHARSWLDQDDVRVHLVRYEDLHADTAAVFGRALDFLGVRHTPEAVARAVRHSDFAELKRQEMAHGFDERFDSKQAFFRLGQAGAWHRQLDPTQISMIESHHLPMMQRLGYTPAAESSSRNHPLPCPP